MSPCQNQLTAMCRHCGQLLSAAPKPGQILTAAHEARAWGVLAVAITEHIQRHHREIAAAMYALHAALNRAFALYHATSTGDGREAEMRKACGILREFIRAHEPPLPSPEILAPS